MAFKTRYGRTVAVGRGAMLTSLTLWFASMLLAIPSIAPPALVATWLVAPTLRTPIERILPEALAVAIVGLSLMFMLRALEFLCATAGFIGPRNRVRDGFAGIFRSRAGQCAIASLVLTLALIGVLQNPFGALRFPIAGALVLTLIFIDSLVFRGLLRISRTSKSAPYFSGMSEEEKDLADRPWPKGSRPSFPDPTSVSVAADALRYARRAEAISQAHTWSGAGIILVFSAFIGNSISAMVTDNGAGSMPTVMFILGAIALGYWLQRRARSYENLAKSFENRATAIRDQLRRPSIAVRGRALRRTRVPLPPRPTHHPPHPTVEG